MLPRSRFSAALPLYLAAILSCVLVAGVAAATPFSLILKSQQDASAGSEIFHLGFPSIDDLKSNTNPDLSATVFDVGAAFDLAAMAHDGSSYHVFLESKSDAQAGQEIFHAAFTTLDDFINGGILASPQRGFTQFNVGPVFDLVGVAHDGDAYHVFLESNDDESSGQEFFHAQFASLADFLAGDILSASPRGFSVFDIGPTFDVAGVAHDGGSFRVLLESQTDSAGGQELFHAEFSTLEDLLTGGILTSPDRGFTQIDVNGTFDVSGFAAVSVPEPSVVLLLAGGMLGLAWVSRAGATPG